MSILVLCLPYGIVCMRYMSYMRFFAHIAHRPTTFVFIPKYDISRCRLPTLRFICTRISFALCVQPNSQQCANIDKYLRRLTNIDQVLTILTQHWQTHGFFQGACSDFENCFFKCRMWGLGLPILSININNDMNINIHWYQHECWYSYHYQYEYRELKY